MRKSVLYFRSVKKKIIENWGEKDIQCAQTVPNRGFFLGIIFKILEHYL